MKKFFGFILIFALAFAAIPVGAVTLAPGLLSTQAAVQAEMAPLVSTPLDLCYFTKTVSRSRGARASGARASGAEGGEPEEGGETESRLLVPEGKVRRFECTTRCYWDQTLYKAASDLGRTNGDIVEFQGPIEIPKNFQFENWQEL